MKKLLPLLLVLLCTLASSPAFGQAYTYSVRYATSTDLLPGSGWAGSTSTPSAIGSPGDTHYNATVIANWSVIPRRVFNGTLAVGLIAFHPNGIAKVEFAVDGGPWKTVTQPIYTPWDGLTYQTFATTTAGGGEYVAVLDSAHHSDGKIEVRARITPATAGQCKVLQGGDVEGTQDGPSNSLFLVSNQGGTYNGTDWYVAASGGNDSNNGTSSGTAFATITKACIVANAGDRINLLAGTHIPGARVVGFNHNIGFITIQAASGVDPSTVIIAPPDDNSMNLRTDYLCIKGIPIHPSATNRLLNVFWFKDLIVTGVVPPANPSSSSVAIATSGSVVFNVGTGKTYPTGAAVVCQHDDNNVIVGTVASYSGSTLTVTANDQSFGSGTYASWTVQLSANGIQWATGGDWFTNCTMTSIWQEAAQQSPLISRGCSINGSRENGLLSPKVVIDLDVTNIYDVADGHTDEIQWAGADGGITVYRVRGLELGAGGAQCTFADQQLTDVVIASCVFTLVGVSEIAPSSGNQFGKGAPARNINNVLIVGCTYPSFCIFASNDDSVSSDFVVQATAASQFAAGYGGVVFAEGCHAYNASGGFGNVTQVGTNTSGDGTMSSVFNSDVTPKAPLLNRISRVLVATDASGNRRTQQNVGAY